MDIWERRRLDDALYEQVLEKEEFFTKNLTYFFRLVETDVKNFKKSLEDGKNLSEDYKKICRQRIKELESVLKTLKEYKDSEEE